MRKPKTRLFTYTVSEVAEMTGLGRKDICRAVHGDHPTYPRLRAIWKNPNATRPTFLIRESTLEAWLEELENL